MTLQLRALEKSVAGDVHLHPLDLELTPGINVIIGPTGAGKTTLLRLIAGLDKASAGQVLLNGRDLSALAVQERNVAVVYQQFINYPSFTVYDNIASPLRANKNVFTGAQRTNKGDIDKRVNEVAERLGLQPYLQRLPAELSGGQQQRVAIARALAKQADIVLLDEPLVNLDYKLREALRREMLSLFSDEKTIAVYATTEPLEAALLGQTVAVLDEGKVLQSGNATALFKAPNQLRTAEILSDPKINSCRAHKSGAQFHVHDSLSFVASGQHSGLDDGDYHLGLFPRYLSLHAQSPSSVQINAQVELAEVAGSETFIHIRIAEHDWVVQQQGVHHYEMGSAISVYFEAENLLFFDQQGFNVSTTANKPRELKRG